MMTILSSAQSLSFNSLFANGWVGQLYRRQHRLVADAAAACIHHEADFIFKLQATHGIATKRYHGQFEYNHIVARRLVDLTRVDQHAES